MDTLWLNGDSIVITPSGEPILCDKCPCIEVRVEDVELMMYQDGKELVITLDNGGKFTSVSQLAPSNIHVEWGASGEMGGKWYEILELQWSEHAISFTNPALWAVEGGNLVWRNTVRPTNAAEPVTLTLMFAYGENINTSAFATGTVDIGIGSVDANWPSPHIWGDAKSFSITVREVQDTWFYAGLLSVSASKDGNPVSLYYYLRNTDDTEVSFFSGWTPSLMQATWQRNIKAIYSEPVTLDIEIGYGKMEPYIFSLELTADIKGSISSSPRRRKINEDFTVVAEISGAKGEAVPRYPKSRSVTYEYIPAAGGVVTQGPGGWTSNTGYSRKVQGSAPGIIVAKLTYARYDNSEGVVETDLHIVPDAPIIDILEEPASLHIYGGGKPLSISVDHLGTAFPASFNSASDRYLTVSYDLYDDAMDLVSEALGDVLERQKENGEWVGLSFGTDLWTSGEFWDYSENVRAKGGSAASSVIVTITVYYYDASNSLVSTVESIAISITEDVEADVQAPDSADQGSKFTVAIEAVSPTGEDLPRLPANVLSVSHGATDLSIDSRYIDDDGEVIGFHGFDEGRVSRTGAVDEVCVYRFETSYKGDVVNTTTVTIKPIGPFNVSDLIKACNERAVNIGNTDYYLDPSTPITWDDRGWFSTFIYNSVSPFTGWSSGNPHNEWRIDTFEADLMTTLDLIRDKYQITDWRVGEKSTVFSWDSRYRTEDGSTRIGDWVYDQPTQAEAIRFAKAQINYTSPVKAATVVNGNQTSNSTYSRSSSINGGYPTPSWTASFYRTMSKDTLKDTSKEYTTVAIEVIKHFRTIPMESGPRDLLGRRMPPFGDTDNEATEMSFLVPPGGDSLTTTFGGLERLPWPRMVYEHTYNGPTGREMVYGGLISGWAGISMRGWGDVWDYKFMYRT